MGNNLQDARLRLIEVGGRTAQDLGVGRIVGQVLVYLYLQERECSLDQIGVHLGLSKASVSIAVRQLEKLGLARKVWITGDRKNYFRSAENITNALQQGLLGVVRQRVELFGHELEVVRELIEKDICEDSCQGDSSFLMSRITRALTIQKRLQKILGNPLLNLFSKLNR
ncbi:hypothetical protein LA52FAK_09610 [Desulforhopalus sp. 52FAK]